MVRTDHSALRWLMKFRTLEGQIARWLQKLQDYDFKVLHRAGRKHGNAEAMSRRPCPEDCKHCTRAEANQDHSNECRVQRTTLKPDERSNRSPEDLQREQRNDPSLGIIVNWLEASPIRPSWREVSPQSLEVKSCWRLWESLSIQDGVLTYRWERANRDVGISLRVLPRCMRWDAWGQLHEDPGGGHLGISKTLGKLR